jgi:hypothetical protein
LLAGAEGMRFALKTDCLGGERIVHDVPESVAFA